MPGPARSARCPHGDDRSRPDRASAADDIPDPRRPGGRLRRACWVWPSASGAAPSSRARAGPVGIVLAELGGPWVLVAFAAGALVAAPESADPGGRAGRRRARRAWPAPARWWSRRSPTTATPPRPRPCSGRPSGCWSAGRPVSPAPPGGPDPAGSWRRRRPGRSASPWSPRGSAASTSAGSTPPATCPVWRRRGWSSPGLALPVLLTRVGPPASWPRAPSSCWPPPSPLLVVVSSHGLGLA